MRFFYVEKHKPHKSIQCLDFSLKHYSSEWMAWGCFTGYLKQFLPDSSVT